MSAQGNLLPVATGRESWRTLRALARARRWPLIAAVAALVAGSLLAMLTPLVLGRIVDLVAAGKGAAAMTGPAAALVAVAIGAAFLKALGQVLVARVGEPSVAELREKALERALDLDLETVEAAGTGDLVSRVTEDMQLVAEVARDILAYFAISLLTIALTVVGLGALDWRFALAGLCAVPIQALTARWYLKAAPEVYAAERVARGALAQRQLDSIGGARTVRAFGLGERHLAGVAEASRAAIGLAMRAVRTQTRFYGRLNGAEFVGLTAILIVGFLMVRADIASIGEATAAALLFIRLFDPINIVLGLLDDIQQGGAGLARLAGVIDMPRRPAPEHPREPASAAVETEGVTFAYRPGHVVVDGVDLSVAPGERVALVGASGAGKTTLVKLIGGVHATGGGAVRLGGVPLEDLDQATLRRTVALVSQEVHVFAGTVADDLRLAAPEATEERLWEVLTMVGADGWATALPHGLATVVGEGGHRLTPTQGQQLALARLALADPPIAVLDEATAEAGSAGSRELEAAAARVLRGRTSLVVAHRLSQAADSDRVVVMAGGRVVEQGPHEELIAAGGGYARLWEAWRAHRAE
ncbi:multidrug ABC transporter permease [Actinorhabdospora filicis]|uniref:Multidrug ABC transporter permease n=1 Tax=Actinorhabdospora filicis TaxID=1785913 RepID=A0A9W6SFR6_9ACTN|nr:ABC transporter ATP-binding protein [Actinorhabdospora filicis]GLZ75498.1 multidrug ABC transporter permease [Actinorhabdospora filicis]